MIELVLSMFYYSVHKHIPDVNLLESRIRVNKENKFWH